MSQSWRAEEHGISPDDIPVPDVSNLITENDEPVDNVFSEKQMRLLTEPLYTSWRPPEGRPYFLAANVGVFAKAENTTLVPDVFLSMDTNPKRPLSEKRNRSYFVWEHGKPPDVVIEVVSNNGGEELTRKLRGYERIRISHYVVFDPYHELSKATLTRFVHYGGALKIEEGPLVLTELGLGLTLWRGEFENEEAEWLRWCDADGKLIPTGKERAEQEKERAEQEKERAEQEKERAEQEKERAERMAAKLRELGLDPDAL